MANLVFLDIETRKLAAECPNSWADLLSGEGGMSVAATILEVDGDVQEVRLWDDSAPAVLVEYLEEADVVIGWNSERFDLPIISALAGRAIALRGSYDLKQACPKPVRLQQVAQGTLGEGKRENSEDAPSLARTGQWVRLIDYCIADVTLLRRLFHFAQKHGILKVENGEIVEIRPWRNTVES